MIDKLAVLVVVLTIALELLLVFIFVVVLFVVFCSTLVVVVLVVALGVVVRLVGKDLGFVANSSSLLVYSRITLSTNQLIRERASVHIKPLIYAILVSL